MLVLVNVEPSKLVVSFSKVRPRKTNSQPLRIGKTGVKKTMMMMRMIQSFSGVIGQLQTYFYKKLLVKVT